MEKIYDREDGGTVLPFIQLNRSTYPLYVGGNAVGNGGDKVGKGSSFLLEAIQRLLDLIQKRRKRMPDSDGEGMRKTERVIAVWKGLLCGCGRFARELLRYGLCFRMEAVQNAYSL